MAQGRMINRAICADKAVNMLTSDFNRLVFTWLIVQADREGRAHGDPSVVRSTLFPRREDISIAQVELALQDIAENKLIVWYEAQGDLYVWFPSFDKNQAGLRKSREAPSRIPPPAECCRIVCGKGPDYFRSNDGVSTDQLPVKGMEWNRIEDPGDGAPEQPEKQQKQPTEHQAKQSDLEMFFSEQTGLPVPARETERQKRSGATQWWNPLRDILEMVDWDVGRAKCLTKTAVCRLRTSKLTIGDVNSIMKTVKALYAEGVAAGNNGHNVHNVEY